MAVIGIGFYVFESFLDTGGSPTSDDVDLDRNRELFAQAIEKRRWDEASELIDLMQVSGEPSAQITAALQELEASRIEERGQQVGFLLGNVRAALEAEQFSEAEGFLAKVEKLDSNHEKLPALRKRIAEGSVKTRTLLMVEAVEEALNGRDWKETEARISALAKASPDHPRLAEFRRRSDEAALRLREDQAKAAELLAKARALDDGTHSTEALALVEKAMRLDPNPEIRELYQKMSAYGRVVRVPADYPTIQNALRVVKVNDRVFVAKGTYSESLIIPAGVELIGESRAETIIECSPENGSVVTVPQGVGKIRIASMTLRHKGLVNDEERYPVVAIDGGQAHLEDLLITRASGHGIAVLDGGQARIDFTTLSDSGWDGLSVNGTKSSARLHQVTAENNLHHGIDFWDGAAGQVSDCRFIKNGRAGLAALGSEEKVTIKTSRSEQNREIGFYFSDVKALLLHDCEAHDNQLGGIVIADGSQRVELKGNRATKNGEAGLIIEAGVQLLFNSGNIVEGNFGKQIWQDAVFPDRPEDDTVSPPPPAPPER